jgi:hypothetical protein
MVSSARFTPRRIWLLALCAITLGLSLAAPVLVETWKADLNRRSGGVLDPLASQPDDENNFTASYSEALDLLDDSALLSTVGPIGWCPVVLALNLPLPAEWAWSPAPPVRPPIFSNSI